MQSQLQFLMNNRNSNKDLLLVLFFLITLVVVTIISVFKAEESFTVISYYGIIFFILITGLIFWLLIRQITYSKKISKELTKQKELVNANGKSFENVVNGFFSDNVTELLMAGEKMVMEKIAFNESLPDILNSIALNIEACCPGGLCSILLLDADGVHLRTGAAPNLPPAYNRAIDGVAIGKNAGSCGTAAYKKERVIVSDIATDPLWNDYKELALSHGLQACWSIPIFSADKTVLGTFAVYYPNPGFPTTKHFELIERATNQAVIAIEKTRAAAALIKSEMQYRNIVEKNPAGIFQITIDGNILSCNNAFAAMLGYASPKEIQQINANLLYFSNNNRNQFLSRLQKYGELNNQELKLKHKDGHPVFLIENCSLRKDIITGLEMIEGVAINVTQRKVAEQQLAESEKNIRYVLSSTSDNFYVIDRKCYVTLINKAASKNLEKAWGKPVNVGTNILPLIPNEDDEPVRGSLVKVFAGETVEYELHLFIKNLPAWVLVKFLPVKDDRGAVVGAYIATKDISEKKLAEETIRESNERYELATKATSDMVWDWNVVTGEVYRSKEGWKKLFKSDLDNSIGNEETWQSKIHPGDIERVEKVRQEFISSVDKNFFEIECRVIREDGSYAYIHDKGYILRNDENKPVRVIGASSDITQRKLAEEELKKLSLVAKQTSNAVIITDTDEKILWVNEAFTRMTEYEPEEVIGKRPGTFLQGPETNPVIVRYMMRKIRNRQSFECDIINYSKSGRKHWVRIQCQPEFDDTGKLLSFFSIQTEITKEKEAEEALKSSEERYRHLFNNTPGSIFIWDMDSLSILQVNETAVEQYGYSYEEFNQITILDLRPPEEHEKIKAFAKQMKINPGRTGGIWKHLNKAGEEMYMNIVSDQILYKGKKAVFAIANNITEKILLEAELEKERILRGQEITDAVISAQENERH